MTVKVLLVDDDPAMQELVQAILPEDEYTVVGALDGFRGLELAAAEQPEVVILDVMLPRMDGYETCRKLKSNIHTAGIPVLMLTGRDDFDARVAGEEVKAEAYLTKPFSPLNLLKTIEHLLELAERKREA